MHHRRPVLRTCWASVCLLFVAAAAVGAPPRPIRPDILSATQLTGQQIDEVRRYVSYWTDQLAAPPDPEQTVEEARDMLLRPLRQSRGIRGEFRFRYAQAALPALREIIAAEDLHAAINAVLVLSMLGTDDAMQEMLRRANVNLEPRWQVRLRAATGCQVLLNEGDLQTIKLGRYVRDLSRAAQQETRHLVLRRLFEAMAAAKIPEARDEMVKALATVVQRIAEQEDKPSDLVPAYRSAVSLLRAEFVELLDDAEALRTVGAKLNPVLGDFLEAAYKQWNVAQQDPEIKEIYGNAIKASEWLLKIVDPQVRRVERAPQTDAGGAWRARDRDRYERDLHTWTGILEDPPYIRP